MVYPAIFSIVLIVAGSSAASNVTYSSTWPSRTRAPLSSGGLLMNLIRAVKPKGYLCFNPEVEDSSDMEEIFEKTSLNKASRLRI